MELIPAIDLMNGKCVRLLKGDFNKRKDFKKEPHEQAKSWEREGAKYIHIVDLDAAKTGSPTNDKQIKKISETVNIPIQIGGGIRSKERIEQLFSYGIEKVIMGTSAIENKELVKDLSNKFPGRIIVGIDAKEGKVSTRGWLEQSNILATDLVKEFSSFKIASFIVTDINTDGTLEGTNEKFIKSILEITDIPVIASGGVGSISDLLSLVKFEKSGLFGVIVGKALYENKFTINEARNVLSSERLNDFDLKNNYYA
ncbi:MULTISPECIES: 1-(5-phosphoribosyl)-5-[(5-phosphoribosylamino)methylideneamino]imidazole-4-carboxamide isomerase [Prochlorococcus]|uniref:1-(5-phosphoribosyl)-5-[(5-phosphoribosylamino)methylideneamino] imidazole-4-carboxamide isomerase n=1 Tax=Prochlorococcus marinus str. MIT 9116 TaxID=167544 RepID=A0A0A1ZLK7_PROMR|nr:1-(5-phosphoribosyl)-5-[(5-phosphoribosylamino)methylideneamino]imidazole-4-carboxamide isomerase [Prochlorococcus marinus]KGF89675.1 Phosphoribosylformimino-5-aminoimidazole carboxamide ribotide isomerase [Prochlorococcus marinus str. MIT 9107]KGF90315.1 Phosphoribosylformimino-5-aminoimidazole carboxamide ribotide isomerase [Prochlorococcus marinus str. MIT 9116]KGF92795.1 Phosphoribosylformimino-5-aminoimidazole carboxamide ribotide isomerase [Prochlorococcus marinus str. MIT 9123]